MAETSRYGARVFFHDDGVILVMQTVKRVDNPGRYVIDHDERGSQRQRFFNPGEDQALVEAIRDAGRGQL